MIGWLILLAIAGAALAAIGRFGRLDRNTLQLVAAALLIGLAGYAWQGSPGLSGAPKRAPEREEIAPDAFSKMRKDMFGQFDTADRWLTIAEGYQRRGDSWSAAGLIRSGLREHPENATLWVGYGNALVVHAGGMVTPAAQLAFQRAAELAPNHPAPRFFLGLSLAQSGRLDEAERAWRELLAASPADAPWRPQIEQQLMFLQQARTMQGNR
jgi:cytochrome c-type biogenesis protein CcmH